MSSWYLDTTRCSMWIDKLCLSRPATRMSATSCRTRFLLKERRSDALGVDTRAVSNVLGAKPGCLTIRYARSLLERSFG
ncbi:hypothetical protein BDQ94DRAFT_140412 [Aspergillus welwitschiae]|uniref:Uncharacterized protein n=1 Tax=Aspergillus welwitschiae TaxID=1341132 RepID=A0A3F3Q7W5_9EURO|nr:hypothetical protein BDQ94DRAFT_140412 [Aspergillus welwitschiae]RDH35215.1 hypothetical protein BDQ94DRAFT_140412 [Aspergillus welwitschiae]